MSIALKLVKSSPFSACFLACLLFFVNGEAGPKAQNGLPPGVLIEKVVCRTDAAQSYALYLPSTYTPEKKWAVLYIFDPFAQGKVPVELFREAAEKFGFIVIGSNNSQNDLGAAKLSEIITAMWQDSHARLSIDEQRVYAAGLSGGARVANYFAIACNGCVAGVISCGATFTQQVPLDKPLRYAIFGTAGVDDFNYPELVRTFEKLKENGTVSRLGLFDGRHGWPPKDLTFDALEWLNLQAMKSGRMATDKKYLEALLAEQEAAARALLAKGDLLSAARGYEALVNDFKDVADTKSAAESLSDLRGRKAYKQALKDEAQSFTAQRAATQKIFSMVEGWLDPSAKDAALQKAAREIEGWRQKAKADADSGERRLARRVLDQLLIESYETALYVNRQQKDYQMMVANLELTRLINPQSPNVMLELARALALGGRKKEALETLEGAVEKGLKDCRQLAGRPEWETLRGNKQFQKIIERLNCRDENS